MYILYLLQLENETLDVLKRCLCNKACFKWRNSMLCPLTLLWNIHDLLSIDFELYISDRWWPAPRLFSFGRPFYSNCSLWLLSATFSPFFFCSEWDFEDTLVFMLLSVTDMATPSSPPAERWKKLFVVHIKPNSTWIFYCIVILIILSQTL